MREIEKTKTSIRNVVLILCTLLLITIPGCITDELPEDEKEGEDELLPLTVIDDRGNSVTITSYPEKIASLSPSVTEILYALHIGDKIVGIDSASNYPSDASDHEVVFSYTGLIEEKLIDVDPDLVFLHHNLDLSEEARDKIRDFGYNLIILNPEVIEDVLDNIELIGKLTNRTEDAKTLIQSLDKRIDEVEEDGQKFASEKIVKVLYVVYFDGTDDPWIAGEDTYIDDIISKAGGKNIISGYEGFIQVSLETVIDGEPDLILCSQNDAFPTPSRESFKNDPTLKSLDAVKNDKVLDINADLVERPGPRIVDGLETVFDHISSL